jgi:hypothetical protein
LFTDTEPLSNGTATSNGYTTKTAGTDYWVATYNGDNNNNPVTSGTGDERVTVSAATPKIATNQQPASVTVGASVADKATVSGGDSPTGTVTFDLYDNPNASGTPLFTDTETLSGGTATSKGYTTRATGTDYWVATYNGDNNNNPVSSGSGDESVRVLTRQTITFTSTPPNPAVVGDSYTPAATGGGSGSLVVFSIDASSGAGVCSLNPAGTTVSFTQAGRCVIDADQAGDAGHAAAPRRQQSFLVVGRPSAVIDSPAAGQTFAVGQRVTMSFSCAEGTGGPGISTCTDINHSTSPGTLDTSTAGQHTYTVTATSKDGQKATASITYTVAAAPTAQITSPASGGVYTVGQSVPTGFSCTEGLDGPGLSSCTDSNGAANRTGSLDTTTAGTFTYTVTATSKDGQSTTNLIAYTVTAAPIPPPNPPATTDPPGATNPTATNNPPGATNPPATNNPPATADPPATTNSPAPLNTLLPITIRDIKLIAAPVTWCKHCTYPKTRLTFMLSGNADVRLKLIAKLGGGFKQVAVTTLHAHKGSNSFRLGGRWHGQLVPHRRVQILVLIKPGASWTPNKTLKLTVNSPYTTRLIRH